MLKVNRSPLVKLAVSTALVLLVYGCGKDDADKAPMPAAKVDAPAPESAYTCANIPSTSAVLVVVIDWTVTGAPPPTGTGPT